MAKKPLHIAILSTFFDPFISGAEMCVDELANRLGRKDAFAITIITARLKRSLPPFENRGRYTIVRVGFGFRTDKWIYPLLAARAAKRVKPDIVHAIMESYAGIALWLLGFIWHGSRRMLTLQSGDLDEKAAAGKIPDWLWKRIHRSPDIVTAISNFLVQRAHAHHAHRVEHIPNGVSLGKLEYIKSMVKPEEKDANAVCCVARLSPEKGVHDLVEAFAMVRANKPNLHLHLIGDGPQRAEIEAMIERLDMKDKVTVHGRLPYDDAMRILARSHIAVLPSRAEGLGIAGLEALALGIPVVASKVGGIPDFIIDEESGLLTPPRKPAEIAHAIERLYNEPALYARCVESASRVAQAYEWKAITARYADLYREILKPRVCIATGIYPPDPGGPATYVAQLESHMEQTGMHVATITFADASRTSFDQVKTFVAVNRRQATVYRYIAYWWKMMVHARRYDCIYVQDSLSVGLPARIAGTMLRKPLVVKVVGDPAWERAQQTNITHGSIEEFQTKRYTMRIEIARTLSRWVVRGADTVVVPSAYLKDMVQSWGVTPQAIRVIYNAPTLPDTSEQLEAWPAGRPLLYVGRLVNWKGLNHLITILPVLAKEVPDLQLVLIGEGPERENLARQAEELGVANRVHLLGGASRPQVKWAMEHAAVFVLFSSYEGLPHVLIEAQRAALPIVASTAGGIQEVVEHKKSGLLVPPDDNMMLLKAIRLMLTDETIRNDLARGARESAARFGVESMVKETCDVFKEYARSAYQS